MASLDEPEWFGAFRRQRRRSLAGLLLGALVLIVLGILKVATGALPSLTWVWTAIGAGLLASLSYAGWYMTVGYKKKLYKVATAREVTDSLLCTYLTVNGETFSRFPAMLIPNETDLRVVSSSNPAVSLWECRLQDVTSLALHPFGPLPEAILEIRTCEPGATWIFGGRRSLSKLMSSVQPVGA